MDTVSFLQCATYCVSQRFSAVLAQGARKNGRPSNRCGCVGAKVLHRLRHRKGATKKETAFKFRSNSAGAGGRINIEDILNSQRLGWRAEGRNEVRPTQTLQRSCRSPGGYDCVAHACMSSHGRLGIIQQQSVCSQAKAQAIRPQV